MYVRVKITWYVWLSPHNVHTDRGQQARRGTTHRLYIAGGRLGDSLTVKIVLTGEALVVHVTNPLLSVRSLDQRGLTGESSVNVSTVLTLTDYYWYLIKVCGEHQVRGYHIHKGKQMRRHLQKENKGKKKYDFLLKCKNRTCQGSLEGSVW